MRRFKHGLIIMLCLLTAGASLAGCRIIAAPTPSAAPPATATPEAPTPAPVQPTQPPTPAATPAPTASPSPEAPTQPAVVVIVLPEALNVRSGPGVDYKAIATVSSGAELPVIGRREANDWFKVIVNGQEGWVVALYVEVRGSLDEVPVMNY